MRSCPQIHFERAKKEESKRLAGWGELGPGAAGDRRLHLAGTHCSAPALQSRRQGGRGVRGSRETAVLPCCIPRCPAAAARRSPDCFICFSERKKAGRLRPCEVFPQLSPSSARWQTPCVAQTGVSHSRGSTGAARILEFSCIQLKAWEDQSVSHIQSPPDDAGVIP